MAALKLGHSIRYRLLVLALVPVLLVMPLVVGMAYLWSQEVGYRHLLMKVSSDLAVAQDSFAATQQRYLLQLALAAESLNLRDQLANLQQTPTSLPRTELAQQLLGLQQQNQFDYVRLIDPQRCNWLGKHQCQYPDSPLLQQALAGQPANGVELFSAEQLRSLSAQLAVRAYLPLTDTARAQPTQRIAETRGMMLHFVYPLTDQRGEVSALLTAGILMNGNFAFVDKLKATVYGEGTLVDGSLGTVTLFLDDVRISTNVPDQQQPSRRALGTRVSEQVRQQVLDQGLPWLNRAFVVSDWYVSGYQPIVDVQGQRVGMLYTGFLEAPFKAEFYQWLQLLSVFFVIALLLCGYWAVRRARAIFKPVEQMAHVITRIRQGEHQRMPPLKGQDELSILALQFNQLLDQLEKQHLQIQQAADQLELKVAERTADLKQHIVLLQRTREQLVAKGKLAAIGELTAGIAHEINNPTAVILGYLDLMMAELGEAAAPVEAEAQLIVEQVERIRAIINNLLQFSRPDDYRAPLTAIDINQVVRDTQPLIKHDLARKQIQLQLDLRASRKALGNKQQLQQVLINLIINAVNAMTDGGRLRIRSRNWRQQGVLLVVRDDGCGIAAELLNRVFDPFFSKTQGGTGLGLSVSYAIVQRLDAEIDVRSRVGVGSCFYLWLKPADEVSAVDPRVTIAASE